MSQGIHWDLYLPDNAAPATLLDELRVHLWTQDFHYIGQVIHRIGEATDFSTLADTDPDRYPMIAARRLLFLGPDTAGVHRIQELLPLEAYALLTAPAPGCEPAVFGFGRYPDSVVNQMTGKEIKTGVGSGWWGHSFCTTRGERPAHGRVLKALDFLQAHQALAALKDETDFAPQIIDPEHAAVID
jgi:hypothetical protein